MINLMQGFIPIFFKNSFAAPCFGKPLAVILLKIKKQSSL